MSSTSCRVKDVPRHPSISCTLPLTKATVPPNASGSGQFPSSSTRVHGDLFADNKAIGDEFADGLTGIGIRDLIDFIRVEPNLALSAAGDGGGESLLGT